MLVRNNVVHEKNCFTCEFNFGSVCAGSGIRKDNSDYTYGMPMEEAIKMFPDGCVDYRISFSHFCDLYDDVKIKE